MNYLVGLTGGIGSGKSTVAELFARQGARIIDTDLISHRLTGRGGGAVAAIRDRFGDGFIAQDGSLDRKRMREHVFSDPAEKGRLEAILHPLILAEARELALTETSAPYTLIVVPLLFESGRYADWLQCTIVVDCPEAQQVARTVQRSGMNEATVRAIMSQQLARSERLRLANEVIHNDGSLQELKDQVDRLHLRLRARAAENN